ncbi:MAG: N(2)-fixation sustaining protein CowN [Halorhodospira sp.]
MEAPAPDGETDGTTCEQAIYQLLQRVETHIAAEATDSMVRRYLERELGGRDGSERDTRQVIHAQINVIRELFQRGGDEEGLELLLRVERECC